MAYATSEQNILQITGATLYIGPDEVEIVAEGNEVVRLSGPMWGYVNDLRCSLYDLNIQEEEIRKGIDPTWNPT